jgi:hypothetical protein
MSVTPKLILGGNMKNTLTLDKLEGRYNALFGERSSGCLFLTPKANWLTRGRVLPHLTGDNS